MKKKKTKKGIKIFIFLLIVVVFIGDTLFSRRNVQFIAKDFCSRVKVNAVDDVKISENLETVSITYDELKTLKNVTADESMLLVNDEHRLKIGYEPQTVMCAERDASMNISAVNAFEDLSAALMEETGETLYISSALRSFDDQKRVKAEEGKNAQEAGASEHETGLALDVYVGFYTGSTIIESESGQFINENCGDYGFIIRYPYFGESETGIPYEPWHLRYVGYPHSKIISDSLVTYEEYIELYEIGKFYEYDGYIISRQNTNAISIPKEFESAVISEDNAGCIFLTFKI